MKQDEKEFLESRIDSYHVAGLVVCDLETGEATIQWKWPENQSDLWRADCAKDVVGEALQEYNRIVEDELIFDVDALGVPADE
jgi:hypothetical protein